MSVAGRHGGPRTHAAWTPEEEAILRAHADKGPSWNGWHDLVPRHTTSAIFNRRKKLGIAGARATKAARKRALREAHAHSGTPLRVALPPAAGEWDGDQLAWLTEAMGLMADTGHTLAECVAAITAISNAYREETQGW